MGVMRHHAIIVSGWHDKEIEEAHGCASASFDVVTPIVASERNGVRTFFVPPDGSKEGWPASIAGDERRRAFVDWLKSKVYSDGSGPLEWVEVQYADEDHDTKTLTSSDDHYKEQWLERKGTPYPQ